MALTEGNFKVSLCCSHPLLDIRNLLFVFSPLTLCPRLKMPVNTAAWLMVVKATTEAPSCQVPTPARPSCENEIVVRISHLQSTASTGSGKTWPHTPISTLSASRLTSRWKGRCRVRRSVEQAGMCMDRDALMNYTTSFELSWFNCEFVNQSSNALLKRVEKLKNSQYFCR